MSASPTTRAILSLGGVAEAAKVLQLPRELVYMWMRRGRTPIKYVLRVSKASGIPSDEFLLYEEKLDAVSK